MTQDPATIPLDVVRIAWIIGLAVLAHFVVRFMRTVADHHLDRARKPQIGRRRSPKLPTVLSLGVSAATFVIYFIAIGLVLGELGVDLTAYFATATVIGLAVGFGSQGLVQDIVIGLTLIFTDALDIGDMVEVSGQIGRVQNIGLRFTTLSNVIGQTVYIPNRNIGVVGRYRRGVVRAYVDVQLPESENDADEVVRIVEGIAAAVRDQHGALLLQTPETLGIMTAADAWRFVRLKFRLWPGQNQLLESVLRPRIVAALKQRDEGYADWMVTVTYRAT